MKKSALVFFIILHTVISFAQKSEKDFKIFDPKKVYYGGNFGIGSTSSRFSLLIAPEIGYYILPNLLVATGTSYNYMKENYDKYIYKYNAFGQKVFSRYYPKSETIPIINNLFAHLEYEFMSIRTETIQNSSSYGTTQLNLSNFYIGGGYIQHFGGRFNMYMMILFNLNQEIDNPFPNPVYRVGFGI